MAVLFQLAAGLLLLAAAVLPLSVRAGSCPFLPQYEPLRQAVAAAPDEDALRLLYTYAADPLNENPAACEAFDLEAQIGERERALVALVAAGRLPLHPSAAFHCRRPDPLTTLCNGIVADDTTHPGVLLPPTQGRFAARLESRLPGARLLGLYLTSFRAALDGRPATRVSAARGVIVVARRGGTVLIALFTAPAPFRVRKLVWYY